jgi:hypothetical protein
VKRTYRRVGVTALAAGGLLLASAALGAQSAQAMYSSSSSKSGGSKSSSRSSLVSPKSPIKNLFSRTKKPSSRTLELPNLRNRLLPGHHLEPYLKKDIVATWVGHHYRSVPFTVARHGGRDRDGRPVVIQESGLAQELTTGHPEVLFEGFLDGSRLVSLWGRRHANGTIDAFREEYPRGNDPSFYDLAWPQGHTGEPVLVNRADPLDVIDSTRLTDVHVAPDHPQGDPRARRAVYRLRRAYTYQVQGYNRKDDATHAVRQLLDTHLDSYRVRLIQRDEATRTQSGPASEEARLRVQEIETGKRASLATLIGELEDGSPVYFGLRTEVTRPNPRGPGPVGFTVTYQRQDGQGNTIGEPRQVRDPREPVLPEVREVFLKITQYPTDGRQLANQDQPEAPQASGAAPQGRKRSRLFGP